MIFRDFNVVVPSVSGLFLGGALIFAAGSAQANSVILTSTDGDIKLSGNLLSFDGETYEIETSFGKFEAPADSITCEGSGCPVMEVTYGWGAPKIGEDVSITANDGAARLAGTLLDFADEKVTISTRIGEFVVSLANATCAGPGCPPRTETVTYVIPSGGIQLAGLQVAKPTTTSDAVDHSAHAGHAGHSAGAGDERVTDTFYPDNGQDTPYEIPPEIRTAGPGEVVEVLLPVALENFAWRHNGVLDLFDDHMAGTEDIGELKHHHGGVGFEIKDASGDRLMGLLGHHAKKPNEQITMLANNQTDVAFITGPVTDEERAIIASAGQGDLDDISQQRVIAVDGYVAVVSPNNPLSKIALSDLQQVFAGQITNWSQLGGPDAPVNVYTFPTGEETFYKTRDVLLRPAGLEISPNAQELRLTRQIIEAVMADPNGIGFVSYARRRGTKALSLVMACGLEIDPNPLSIKTERYPLVQRMAAFSRQGPQSELVADFLSFVESPDFDAGVEKAGFVSLAVQSTPLLSAAQRFAQQVGGYANATEIERARNVLAYMDGRSSLSAAFRFRLGSAELDQRAQRDLKRVVEFMKENPNAEYTVVGFADSSGPFPQNEVLSLRRAQSVIDALRASDPSGRLSSIDLPAIGASELNAVACNDTPAERATNRRVEIWVKS